MTLTKTQILDALQAWINQRPGLEFGNYGDVANYRQESRRITRQKHDAEELLRSVRWRDGITAERLANAFRAYSGRLELTEKDGEACLDYCTGQYWPTEYRAAACAVLASALWDYVRDECMPAPELVHNSETGETFHRYKGLRAGDWLRTYFRKEYGPRIAAHWFD